MPKGIVDFLEFAAAVVLAAPIGLLGVIRLSGGDVVGGVVFLGVAGGMILLDRLVLAPREVVAKALSGLVGRTVGADED